MNKFHDKPTPHVSQITLKVLNLKTMIEYYTEVLGFNLINKTNDSAELGAGNEVLLVLKADQNYIAPIPQRSGLYHYAILLPNRSDLGGLLLSLQEKNLLEGLGAGDHIVSEALYFNDPEGNGIEVTIDRPEKEWPYINQQLMMGTERVDIENLIRDAKTYQGLPQGTKIGHIHLHVGDLVQTEQFYIEYLGLDLIQKYGRQALFMSYGGYHHHVGANTWNGRGVMPQPSEAAGLDSFKIGYYDPAQLEKIKENLKSNNYPFKELNKEIEVLDPSQNKIILELI